MTLTIRRLEPGDEKILERLATEDAEFDLDGRGGGLAPLEPASAACFLANPSVLFWTAADEDDIVGFLYCVLVPLRSDKGQELLLYEIGVRHRCRRRGIGRALLDQMECWMRTNDIDEVWVLADNPTAVEFYRGCAFGVETEQPTYMTRDLS